MATKPITRTPTRTKALAYLREQNVRILTAVTPAEHRRPTYVEAVVRGHQDFYQVRLDTDVWTCTCGRAGCPHVPAVQMVTGWPSAAAKAGA
jgi:uncharacterized Zn finger protein